MITLRKIVPSLQSVIADTISGTIDGSNQVFYTSYGYRTDHITVYYNGQALHPNYDFIQTGSGEITLIYITPTSGDNLRASYELNASSYNPNIKGIESVVLESTSHTITFNTTFPDANYNLSVDLVTSDENPSIYSSVVGSKTVNGFTVFFSGVIDTGNYTLEWQVFR